MNDLNGHEVNSVTIGKGPSLTINIDPDVDVYVMAPTLIWVTPYKFLGTDFAALIVPTFANSSPKLRPTKPDPPTSKMVWPRSVSMRST